MPAPSRRARWSTERAGPRRAEIWDATTPAVDRHGHQRRLRPALGRADRPGLCRQQRHCGASAIAQGVRPRPRPERRPLPRCRSFPTAISASLPDEDALDEHPLNQATTSTSASKAPPASSASAITPRSNGRHRLRRTAQRSARSSSRGDEAAVVRSIKMASEIYAPVAGEVTAVQRRARRPARFGQRSGRRGAGS